MHPAFPPDPSRLEIDRVEWVPASAHALRVYLLGRWHERPPGDTALLLVGDGERRHGFEALASAPAGVLLAFEVPNELRAALTRDISLQVGSTEMSVPAAVPGPLDDAPIQQEGEVIDRAVLAERRARRAELSEDAMTRRAEAAEQSTETLEAQLENLEERLRLVGDERAELEASVSENEHRLRAAESREQAEQQRRAEIEEELDRARQAHDGEIAGLRRELDAVGRRAADVGLEDLRAEVAQLERMVGAERAERERAELLVAESREAAMAELKRLEYELAARREVHDEMLGELTAARSELQALRAAEAAAPTIPAVAAEDSDLTLKIAELERRTEHAEREAAAVRDVLATRSVELERARVELRRTSQAQFEAERRQDDLEQAWQGVESVRRAAAELREQLDAERGDRVEQAAAIKSHVAGLREQLIAAVTGLRDALDSERAARATLERQLANERKRAEVARAEADRAISELDGARERADRLDERVVEAQRTLRGQVDRARAAEQGHLDREQRLQDLVAEVLRTSASLRSRFEAEIRQLERQLTERLVAERTEAAEKLAAMEAQIAELREHSHGATDASVESERRTELKAQAESLRVELARVRALAEGRNVAGEPAEEMIGGLDAAASRLRAERPPIDEDAERDQPATAAPQSPGSQAEPSGPATPLGQRRSQSTQPRGPWLARAIANLAADDSSAAARMLVAVVPAQAIGGRDVTYDLDLGSAGTFRAQRRNGATTIQRVMGDSPRGADLRISGPFGAIAELIASGARKRPDELRVAGRKLRFRRLLKDNRRPLQLVDLQPPAAEIEPGLLLTVVAAAIDPGWTVGRDFAISWKVGGASDDTWTIVVTGGTRPAVIEGLPEEPPNAVVYVSAEELAPLLAGLELSSIDAASVVGDASAVELLRRWFERAQRRV